MIRQMPETRPGEERRRFERIDIDSSAQVLALDSKGKKAGVLRQLARGGFMMEPEKNYEKDRIYRFTIHEPNEDIKVEVSARLRFLGDRFAGFEFVELNSEAAVQIGLIIGKYYDTGKA